MEFYTRSEAAKYFKVHPRTIERWLRNGSIKGYKLGKGKTSPWRISKDEIDGFLEKNKV
jgi:excisionase family DNA binding protein